MKLAIIGSRSFNDWNKFNDGIAKNTSNSDLLGDITIISGGANGTDTMAEKFSEQTAIPIEIFLPDYAVHGKGATHIRNRKIVDVSDRIIAFWDGVSKGTQSVIEYAKKKEKDLRIINI